MLEFIVLERAIGFPGTCIGCNSQTGPVLDTHREVAGLRVYLCQECIKRGARIFGFVEGNRLDELAGASASVAEKEREIAALQEQLEQAKNLLEGHLRNANELDVENEMLAARVKQLETAIREADEASRAHMSLVGSDNAA